MAGSSNSGSGTTTTEVPEWLQQAYQGNVTRAQGIANSPFQAYGGQMSAGDNAYLSAARDQAVGGTYAGRSNLDEATQRFSEAGNLSPMFVSGQQVGDVVDVNPGNVPGSDLSNYQNPYENQVVQGALGDIDLQRQRSLNESNAATPRGAFGGSRQGVADALTNEAYGRQSASTAAQLRQGGYDRATGLLTSDLDRGLAAQTQNANLDYTARSGDASLRQQADLANQQNELNSTSLNLQGAQGLAGVAQQRANQANTSAGLLSSLGGQLQNTQQAGIDAAMNQYQQQQQDPLTKQALLNQSVLGIGSNAGSTSTSNSKAKGYST